jgi:hypothetical protein
MVFYSNISFNAIKSPYFQDVVNAIVVIGLGFKVPTLHDIRVSLLGDCKRVLLVKIYLSKWANDGCTIMVDGWSDQNKELQNKDGCTIKFFVFGHSTHQPLLYTHS